MLKSFISKFFAKTIVRKSNRWMANPIATQEKVFLDLIQKAQHTKFGKSHNFQTIKSYNDFKANVPIRDYEGLKEYITAIKNGENDVLWPGAPLYFSKTSGTTSGVKYIPITTDSIPFHISAARDALLFYIYHTGNTQFVDGKMIFLSGSPELDFSNKIPTGRLSGIVNHFVPSYLRKNQVPSYKTNCIEDWESKVDAIVEETYSKNMTLISGIPPWVQMYFDKLTQKTRLPVGKLFPNFQLFVYGGVNFEPYRKKLEASIGRKVDSIELYPASEGFIAFQDQPNQQGLLLLLNSGMFYEFIPASEFYNSNPTRISLKDVELGVNYAIILNTNAGLWGYNIGDTVKFVSLKPYRIMVTGRVKHFLSAFGEHVIGEEVDKAMLNTLKHFEAEIVEFTVAPLIDAPNGPCHEWQIEFGKQPQNLQEFADYLDKEMQTQNIYYQDLIQGNVLKPLRIRCLSSGAFIKYMKENGKLGGQNKVPRLANDRTIANQLD